MMGWTKSTASGQEWTPSNEEVTVGAAIMAAKKAADLSTNQTLAAGLRHEWADLTAEMFAKISILQKCMKNEQSTSKEH